MLNIPDWAYNFMKKKECPYCSSLMGDADIVQVGIKLYEGKKPCLYYESNCKVCDRVSHTTIFTDTDLSPYQLAAEIYNSYDREDRGVQHNKIDGIQNKKFKPNAFDKESASLKSFMIKNDSHEEFLKYIGLTDMEIDLYAKWNSNDENIT